MIDREKVIKGLECCLANAHNKCPYTSTDEGVDEVIPCTTYLMQDALALLKAQEPTVLLEMPQLQWQKRTVTANE